MRTWLRVMGVMCLLTAVLPVGAGLILLEAVSSGHLSEDVWRWLHDALAGEIEWVQLVVLSFAAFLVTLSCVAFGLATKLCVLESLAGHPSRCARDHRLGSRSGGSRAGERRWHGHL